MLNLRTCAVGVALLTSVFSNPVLAQDALDAQLRNGLEPLIETHRGDVGLAILNIKTGEHYEFNSERPMPTASLIKLPVLVTTYRLVDQGKADLNKRITLKDEDKVPGSGELTEHMSSGAALTLRDYLRLMIRHSDNTATNIVAHEIGLATVSEDMESLGLRETKLHSMLYGRGTSVFPERSQKYGIGSTTAAEMVALLAKLEAGEVASRESTTAIREHLLACADDTKLGRRLSGVEFAHKTGAIANCRTDAGILYTDSGPVAICLLTNRNEDQRFADDNEAHVLAGQIGKLVKERFGGRELDATLRQGAFGKTVEALQRTLNKRLTPSPGLSIDGDFGPATQAAVEAFQRAHSLPMTGEVGRRMWERLGTLIDKDDPVPPPEVVNSEQLPVLPQPGFDDPPQVTCKAWVILEPRTGALLFEFNADEPLETASTTKIMTALLVCGYALQNPSALEETVTFSQRADRTPGSTAAIRAGEQVTVRQLLYGLLLPSGNDASVALAEHFGERLAPPGNGQDSYEGFVAAMNQLAKDLGLSTAHYVNPHGLPDTAHVISAGDLARLSLAAMEIPLFREVVATRQFGCTLSSEQGYSRHVLWKNTNRLLGTEGFLGVKTGTTKAAGACLVAMGKRENDQLLVVVLGSHSSTARYVDVHNLFRWAWRQRAENESANVDVVER